MKPGKPAAARPGTATAAGSPDTPSIAVLPFTNMSGDSEQEYFSDGITEDIVTALSRISGLLVVARNSTMVYKGKAIDAKLVGREQGVRCVLEGSVGRGGDRIRVTAQLIDATTGHHRWAQRYDRDLTDIFAVQDEITHEITVEMRVQLTAGEQARMWAGGTDSVRAWERIIRATELKDRAIYEDNLEGRRRRWPGRRAESSADSANRGNGYRGARKIAARGSPVTSAEHGDADGQP